jgi:hypothetical protein
MEVVNKGRKLKMMADKEIENFEWLIRNLPFDIPIACVY